MKHFFKTQLLAGLAAAASLWPSAAAAAPFTPGNVVVVRIGDGSAALTSAATATFLLEYTPAGVLVQTIALPTATTGANSILTNTGSSSSDALLTRSVDGRYLVLTGYDAAVGTASLTATPSATTNRIIGRVAADGTVDTSTRLADAFSGSSTSGANIRSAATVDGTAFYAVGSNTGVRYVPFGNAAATATTAVTTAAPTNNRVVNIFNGNLYISSASGSFQGISQVGTGLPTTGPQPITQLAGFPTATGPQPYAFYFADLSTTVPGVDVVYVADDRTASPGGIQKWSLVGSTWTLNGSIVSSPATAIRGLDGSTAGTTVSLAASGNGGLYIVSDNAGYNAAPSTSTLAAPIAMAGTNATFRGAAFAPVAGAVATTPTLAVTPAGPLTFTTAVNTPSAAQTISVSGSNLTGAVTVTAPAGYEVAITGAGPYTSTVTLAATGGTQAATSVFVRLAAAAAAGTPSGSLTVTSTGATTTSVSLTGTVTATPAATPALAATPAGPLTFTSTAGTASTAQTVTVSGSNLTGTVAVTAPAGYELATVAAGPYTATTTLTATNGTLAATPVYVRLAAGAAAGTRNGALLIASAGAADVSVILNGTVAAAPVLTPTLASISPVRAIVGGPAFTLTLEGTNLTATTQVTFGAATYTAATVNTGGTRITVEIPASAIATVGQIVVSVTNGGTASNTRDFFVVPAATTVAYEDFEQAQARTSYTDAAPVVLRSGAWTFTQALIGDQFGDHVNQVKGARVRGGGSIAMNFDKPNGAGTVTISAALYGTADTGASFTAEVSTNGGTTYTAIAGTPATLTSTLVPYTLTVNRAGNVRLRFSSTNTTSGTNPRINFDDLFITNFVGTASRTGSALSGLAVFPNPAKDVVTVALPKAGAARVALRDLTGRLVLASTALPASGQLRLPATLAAGTYLLEVQQGAETAVRRVVKE
jgi:hypothetical protein